MRQLTILPLVFLVLLVGCQRLSNLMNGCMVGYRSPDWAKLQQANEQNRELWQSKNIQSYSYTYQIWCFCRSNPINVKVEGEKVSLFPNDAENLVSPHAYTINSHFGLIDKMTENHGPCETFSVEYDVANGFPTKLSWGLGDGTLDAGFTIQNTNFTVLP